MKIHPKAISRRIVVVASAIAVLVVGVLAVQMVMSPREATNLVASAGHAGEADGLWFAVQSAVRRDQSRRAEERVSPPARLTPVTLPRGLQVEIKVQNRADQARILGPRDFWLQSAGGSTWLPTGGSFSEAPLGPREYLHGVLTFDVPETASGLELVWSRSGHEVRIPVREAASGRSRDESTGREFSDCLPSVSVKCGDVLAAGKRGGR